MINKMFSDYSFRRIELLSAWINHDNDDNERYLRLTYEAVDKNRNEYMIIIPKVCLPFINTNEFPWIYLNHNYDYNGKAVEYTDAKIIIIPKKNDVLTYYCSPFSEEEDRDENH